MAVDMNAVRNASQTDSDIKLVQLKRGDERFEVLDAPRQVVRQRLELGAQCLALIKDGMVKGAIWCARERYDEDQVRARFLIPPQTIWDFGVYIPPDFRLGRSFEQLWDGYAQWCFARQIHYSVSRIGTHNIASLRAHKRLPHTVLGYCTFIKIFSRQFCLSPMLSAWHVSRGEDDKPVFQVAL